MKTGTAYPGGYYKFSDEGGKAKDGNLLYFIEPDHVSQYDWFAPNKAAGLMQVGLARINQSIEAFVYCILGAQVNVRSSIIGEGGRAKEAKTEFLNLMEGAISQPDLAKSVPRYQFAVDQAKVRLNLAVAPMACLMPANMIINTASVVGYNNKLKQAVSGTKRGVNNGLNTDKICSLLVTDLMLFLCLSLLMSYHSTCFIFKQYVPLCTTYLPILRLRISVIFLLVHLTFIHITLDFLMLVIYTLINQD